MRFRISTAQAWQDLLRDTVFVLWLAGVAPLSSGCASSGDSQDASQSSNGDDNGTTPEIHSLRDAVYLQDRNNYQSSTTLSIDTIETASGTDLEICWGDVTTDIQCHDVEPQADLDNVAFVRFHGRSEDEVEELFASSELKMGDVDAYFQFHTNHRDVCTMLSSMSLYESDIDLEADYFESDEATYVLLFAAGTTPGLGSRTMTFMRPTSSSTAITVNAPPGCGILDFSAELSSAATASIPAGGPWVVDWSDVPRDSAGNDLPLESIDSLLLGFYEGMTVAQIEAKVMDLELMATTLWELELTGGYRADLAQAKERESGREFHGFDRESDGVWLLGLMCGTCQNPAPVVLVVLEPDGGD